MMMLQRLLVALTLLCGLVRGHNGHTHEHHHHHRSVQEVEGEDLTPEEIVYCNATAMAEKDMMVANQVFEEWMAGDGARKLQSGGPIEVPVYFHVITALGGLLGTVSQSMILAQMEVLNESFEPYFTFNLMEVQYVDNTGWYEGGLSFRSDTARNQMRSSLREGGSGTLNIYSTGTTTSSGSVLLGLATFPSEYENSPSQDGIVVWHETLPGGGCGASSSTCNQGYTTVHEVGHWLGLYHTFHHISRASDGCLEGDDVSDTPRQAQPTSGCPFVAPDTCPTFSGRDPIENFMDYSSDTCKDPASGDGFSPGQIQRMRSFWDRYREGDVVLPDSTPAEMTPPVGSSETVDVYIEFQYDRFPSETSWQIVNSAGQVFLSYPRGSARGLLSGTLSFPPGTYIIRIQDSAGDGTCCIYGLGYVFVSVNGGSPIGGYGIFRSSATVTFTVSPFSNAFVGGENQDGTPALLQVPEGSESSILADAPEDSVVPPNDTSAAPGLQHLGFVGVAISLFTIGYALLVSINP